MMFKMLLLLSMLASFHARAQYTTHSFRHLSTSNGLSDDRVHCITQDKHGFIWVGTNYGLNKYDGYTVQTFSASNVDTSTLPNMILRDLLVTRKGNFYVATQAGLCMYRYEKNNFQRNPFNINFRVAKMIETEPGIIWMHTSKGIMVLDENKGKLQFLSDHQDTSVKKMAAATVSDFALDNKGSLYIGTNAGLFKVQLSNCNVSLYRNDPANSNSISSNDVRAVTVDKQGIIWVATRYYGSTLDRLDPNTGHFKHYTEFHDAAKGWADNRIMDLLIDRNGNLWIASIRAGLAQYKSGQTGFNYYFNDPMLPNTVSNNSLLCIFEDHEGEIWLGTEGYGVDFFQPANNHFTSIRRSYFQQPTLADDYCRDMAEDSKGNFWIATYKGISYLDRSNATYTNYLLARNEATEANNSVRAVVVADDATVWIGTGAGLNKWLPDTRKVVGVNREDSIPQVYISDIMKDRQGDIWVCTVRGLFRLVKSTGKFENIFKRPELLAYKNRSVSNIYQDNSGRYWLSLPNYGVLRYDANTRKQEFFDMNRLDSLAPANNYVTSFVEDRHGIMWISTFHGLTGINMNNFQLKHIRKEQGLPSNKTSGLLVDSLDRIWFGTNNGLCMLNAARDKIYRFDENDGLPSTYFYEGTAQRLMNNYFAYATYKGIVLFKPESLMPQKYDVPVYLTSIRIQGGNWSDTVSPEISQAINFQHDQNYFSLGITGLYYLNPSRINYAYKLEGFDKDWQYTTDRSITYTNVPGGNYNFLFKASVYPDMEGAKEKQVKVHIGTVYYKTWWFTVGSLLLGGLLVYFLVRNKFQHQAHIHDLENKAQSLEKEKAMVMYENLQQQLNPHFLFNSLTSLRSLIKINAAHAGEFLEKMSRIYRYILQNRDNELVPLKEEIAFVQSYIDLQKTRFSDGLIVEISIPDEFEQMKIVPVTLQNLIENAIKHNLVDRDAPLKIDIFVKDEYLVVQNNLQKKHFVETSNRQGLISLQALYNYLDARKVIIEEDGFSFIVRVPLI